VVFVVFVAALAFGAVVVLAGAAVSTAPVVWAFAAASARAVFDSAARALPAAVWAPFALSARPAAIRDFGGLLGLGLARLLRDPGRRLDVGPAGRGVELQRQARLAARGGVRVDRAGLRRPVERRVGLGEGDCRGLGVVAVVRGGVERLRDVVFAAVRRGWRISWRRSACRTRLSPDGVRAPVQVRGVLAKGGPLRNGMMC
jgi:hypothetical protein